MVLPLSPKRETAQQCHTPERIESVSSTRPADQRRHEDDAYEHNVSLPSVAELAGDNSTFTALI